LVVATSLKAINRPKAEPLLPVEQVELAVFRGMLVEQQAVVELALACAAVRLTEQFFQWILHQLQ
jgi:hypothetical protein